MIEGAQNCWDTLYHDPIDRIQSLFPFPALHHLVHEVHQVRQPVPDCAGGHGVVPGVADAEVQR